MKVFVNNLGTGLSIGSTFLEAEIYLHNENDFYLCTCHIKHLFLISFSLILILNEIETLDLFNY